jgi:hypothetical protein
MKVILQALQTNGVGADALGVETSGGQPGAASPEDLDELASKVYASNTVDGLSLLFSTSSHCPTHSHGFSCSAKMTKEREIGDWMTVCVRS